MRILFFFSSRRRHTRLQGDWSSDVCSSDLGDSDITRRRLALKHAQHSGFSGALMVIDKIVDARRKPVSVDLHRRKLRAKRRQALSEALAQMLETSALEMNCSPCHRRPAKT